MYGFIGFVIGFIAGMAVNAYLLQDVPRKDFHNNRKLRLRYGALNWGIALLGMAIGLAVGEAR